MIATIPATARVLRNSKGGLRLHSTLYSKGAIINVNPFCYCFFFFFKLIANAQFIAPQKTRAPDWRAFVKTKHGWRAYRSHSNLVPLFSGVVHRCLLTLARSNQSCGCVTVPSFAPDDRICTLVWLNIVRHNWLY